MVKSIFFVCDHLKGGGAERINLELANEFLTKGYRVYIFLLDGSDIKMKIPDDVVIIDLNIKFNKSLFRRSGKNINDNVKNQIYKYEIEKKPELIIVSYAYAYWLADLFLSENVWLWVHGDITHFNLKERVKNKKFKFLSLINEYRRIYLEKICFKKIFNHKNIIVINKDLYEFFVKNACPKEIRLIYNGISNKKSLSVSGFDKRYDAIFVGRLSEEKQVDVAIRAFHDSEMLGKLAIVGDGVLKKELLDLCDELEINNRVDFIGWVDNPEEYIKQSKLLISCSKTEGYGLVISEALILGVPVVAYGVSDGVIFQLDSPNLRLGIVEPENYEELINKINSIYKYPYSIKDADKERLLLSHRFNDFENLVKINS